MKSVPGVLVSAALHPYLPAGWGSRSFLRSAASLDPRVRLLAVAYLEAEYPPLYFAVGVLGSFRADAASRGGLASKWGESRPLLHRLI